MGSVFNFMLEEVNDYGAVNAGKFARYLIISIEYSSFNMLINICFFKYYFVNKILFYFSENKFEVEALWHCLKSRIQDLRGRVSVV